jgi:hypothetical protein
MSAVKRKGIFQGICAVNVLTVGYPETNLVSPFAILPQQISVG